MEKITRAADVAIPSRVVTLQYLKTKSGEPVRVHCDSIDELTIARMYGMPGLRDIAKAAKDDMDPMKLVEAADAMAPALIHVATALADDSGEPTIRPAFYFDDAHKVPGNIAGRYLRLEEKMDLANAILELSGHGGAASSASFPDGDGEGKPGGVGVVADGEGEKKVASEADGTAAPQS